MGLIHALWAIFTHRERVRLVWILIGTVVGSVLDVVSMAILVPLITLLSAQTAVDVDERWRWVGGLVGSMNRADLALAAAAAVFLFYLIKNLFLTALTYRQFSFVYNGQAELSSRLLRAYLGAPWTFHLSHNSAELLRNVTAEVPLVFGNVVNPLMVLVSELLVTTAVIALLLALEPLASLLSMTLLGAFGIGFYVAVRRRNDQLGHDQQRARGNMIKWVNQGFGSLKEARILGREGFFVEAFAAESRIFARASRYLNTIGQVPRFFLESVIIGGILLVLAVMRWQHRDSVEAFSALALFGVAAFRLMPAVNRAVASVTNIRYHRSAVVAVHEGLRTFSDAGDRAPLAADVGPLPFERTLEIRGVRYRYPGAARDALRDFSLVIHKGTSVGITGPSGAGKTTLVDIIVGLLVPTSGSLLVDGRDAGEDLRAWRRRIGYVPQMVYLLDDSVRRNVALGVPETEIDEARVWQALRATQLETLVRSLPDGLAASVGERGVRFSGGERQRIGIARALYHDPDVLVLDEVTAALDPEMEREVARAIQSLKRTKTLIIITHRLPLIEECDVTYALDAGAIARAVPS